jgi:ATP-dependent DNA helicase RecQ
LSSDNFEGVNQVTSILHGSGSSIVYCASVKTTHDLASILTGTLGEEVGVYNGQLSPAIKTSAQDMFMTGRVRVMCATNAFGMGVDKADIRTIVHHDIPGTPEALVQECGRAGRDEKEAHCHTLFSPKSVNTQLFFVNGSYPLRGDIMKVYRTLQKSADASGLVAAKAEDLAGIAGLDNALTINAIFKHMVGSRVIERFRRKEKVLGYRFIGSWDDARFKKWQKIISNTGVQGVDGVIRVAREHLLGQLDVSESTLFKYTREWVKAGLIVYIPPYNGAYTRLIGDPNTIDFERIDYRRQRAIEKLDMVVKYTTEIPDCDKHAYMEEAFLSANGRTK